MSETEEACLEIEALGIVHAEQGYLILNSCCVYQQGHVPSEPGILEGKRIHQPMRVIGMATCEDFTRQDVRLDQLLAKPAAERYPSALHPYFYKVVAAD
jgi:hypothetical protein